jgi:hypothetical protein
VAVVILSGDKTKERRKRTMTTEEKLIKNKLGMLELASYLQNVSEACRVMRGRT